MNTPSPEEFWNFYKNHTGKETENFFGMTHYRFTQFIQKHNLQKQAQSLKKVNSIDVDELANFYNNNSIEKTLERFDLSYHEFRSICIENNLFKTINRSKELKSIQENIDLDELTKFYRSHAIEETAEKYGFTLNELKDFLSKESIRKSPYPPFEEEFANIDKEEVKKFYENHTRKETSEKFNIPENRMRFYLGKTGIERAAPGFCGDVLTNNNRLKILREKFWNDKERTVAAYEKALKTIEERYGDRNYVRKKIKKSIFEKYGVKSVMELPEFQEKTKNTLFKRYGVSNPGLVNWESRQSKEELTLIEPMKKLELVSNGFEKHKPFFRKLPNGRIKCPDYFNADKKIAVEYNGSFWHKNKSEPNEWKENWNAIGWDIAIIWDFERPDFINNPPQNIEELLDRYPCTFRTKKSD